MQDKIIRTEGLFNGEKLTLETGRLAKNADMAVLATLGDTTVLVTVVTTPSSGDSDFFPLRMDYEERFYAGGLIGGSRFTRREGRPTDDAVVSARLMDHAIRPLFPKDFMDDTQVITTVLSVDGKNSPVLLGFLAASAALSASGLPFNGPIIPLRIQRNEGNFIADLSDPDETSDLDIIVSYLDRGARVHAMEAEAHIVSEATLVDGIKHGAGVCGELFDLVEDFASKVNPAKSEYVKSWLNKDNISRLSVDAMPVIEQLYGSSVVFESDEWNSKLAEITATLVEKYSDEFSSMQVTSLVGEVQKDFVRKLVLKDDKRIDGRQMDEIRPLSAEVGVLPRVHGSALFSRGYTQALTIATLASGTQKLLVQNMDGEENKRYIHHYNFPPFSTGEVRSLRSAGRREIGHGMLAEKALVPVLPDEVDFPYVMRLVSEILSSNGSTSMAATCGSSLALMDAGVPVKAHVGAIGVGLFVDKNLENPGMDDFKLLTDIIGYEDYAGYMDFKMTGTREGVTAIQMELKVRGLPVEMLSKLFETSRVARMKVIDVMEAAISAPRENLSEYAPKIDFLIVDKSVIGQIIGSGGSVIKGLIERFECEIDIEEQEDHATVTIASTNIDNIKAAKEYIASMIRPIEIGDVYEGTVTRVEDYGAFIEIAPKKEGLIHVSEYAYEYVDNMSDKVKVGDKVTAKVISLDNGKIALSKKALDEKPEGYEERPRSPRPSNGGGRRGGPRNFHR